MGYGTLTLKIEELLEKKNISKNRICKDLDIPRSNFNRYCRNECQRLDIAMLCKLLHYLEVDISELLLYQREVQMGSDIQSTAIEPLNTKPIDAPAVSKEIPMYSDLYKKINDILNRLGSVYDELEGLYEELCSIEEAHNEYLDSLEDSEDEQGDDIADYLNSATSDMLSAYSFLEEAINSIDSCLPES